MAIEDRRPPNGCIHHSDRGVQYAAHEYKVYLWDYKTFEDVKKRIPYFIEEVYNEERLHSALGYCPPNEFESLVAMEENKIY